jgi:hypothetical protein
LHGEPRIEKNRSIRTYIGEITFKGEILKGEQPAILDRDLFDAVQTKLQRTSSKVQSCRPASHARAASKSPRGFAQSRM